MRDDVLNEPGDAVDDGPIDDGAGQHRFANQIFGRFTRRVCRHRCKRETVYGDHARFRELRTKDEGMSRRFYWRSNTAYYYIMTTKTTGTLHGYNLEFGALTGRVKTIIIIISARNGERDSGRSARRPIIVSAYF